MAFLREQTNRARSDGYEALVRHKRTQYGADGISKATLRAVGEPEAIASLCEDMLRDEAAIRENLCCTD